MIQPQARLRITHASTGVEHVYGNDLLSDDAIRTARQLAEGGVEPQAVTVTLTTPELLGAERKPLPGGRHRAVLEVDAGAGYQEVAGGTVSNEAASHGARYDDGRAWTITLSDTSLDEMWEALEAVQLRGAVASRVDAAGGRTDIETVGVDGAGLVPTTVGAWSLAAMTAEAFATAGVAVEDALPAPFACGAYAAHPLDVRLFAPRPDPDGSGTGPNRHIPDWTGAQLLELRQVAEGLVVEASYAAYPARSITARLRCGDWAPPVEGSPEYDALPDLDGTDDRLYEDHDWSTEPGETDGVVLDDLAVTWQGGPDGGYIADDEVLETVPQATYAAPTYALGGKREPGRDGGREVLNGQHLELTALLPAYEASSVQTVQRTQGGRTEDVDFAHPAWDAGDGEPDESAIYVISHLAVEGLSASAIVERRVVDPAPGTLTPTMELWARELYPMVATTYGDADRLDLDVPDDALDVDQIVLGDPTAGVRCEGLVWAVASVDHDHDAGTLSLSLERPAGATVAPQAGGESGRYEPAPTLTADAYQYQDTDDQGQSVYVVDAVEVVASVEAAADVPAAIPVQRLAGGDWVAVSTVARGQRSVAHSDESDQAPGANDPNIFDGTSWPARDEYPSGTVTDWVETLAS